MKDTFKRAENDENFNTHGDLCQSKEGKYM